MTGLELTHSSCLGIVSSYGSYQTYYEESILSTSGSFQVSTIGAVQSFCMVFLGFLAGPIFDKGYFKPLVRCGSLLVLLGTVTQAFSTRYWQLLLSQGVCVGVGMSCLAVPSLAIPAAWFTTKMPLANGIIVSASGFGGFVSFHPPPPGHWRTSRPWHTVPVHL